MPDELAALQSEVARLRRQVGRQWAVVALAVGLAALPLVRGRGSAAPPGGSVDSGTAYEASEFRLVGADGQMRGQWACHPAGPTLTLWDADGRVAAVLSAGADGAKLRVWTGDGGWKQWP